MYVLREYGAGVHGVVVFLKYLCEPSGNGACLRSVEDYGRVFQALLCFRSNEVVVTLASDGAARLYFRCRAESLQMRGGNTIGSRTSRVVWEPEAVGREDDVIRSNHDGGL